MSRSSASSRSEKRHRVKFGRMSAREEKQLAELTRMPGSEIDTSDIPEVTDWSKAEIGKFYRPIKQSVTVRLDKDVIAWLKSHGPGYQTRINELLRQVMLRSR